MSQEAIRLKEKALAGGMPLTQKRENLWVDAFRRLIRNRAAVVGGTIVIILIIMAVFAPQIAPRSYEKQVLNDQNTVPAWLLSVFPTMKPYARISNDYLLGAD
jgi:ABC-type dipeptide/oligopeptide/nickel transport system permease subunit